MNVLATVSDRFQTVIPVAIRNKLNIVPGDKVEFSIIGDDVVVRKPKSRREKQAEWLEAAMETYIHERDQNIWGDLNDDFLD